MVTNAVVVTVIVALITCGSWRVNADEGRLSVKMTLVGNASAIGACKFLCEEERDNKFNLLLFFSFF